MVGYKAVPKMKPLSAVAGSKTGASMAYPQDFRERRPLASIFGIKAINPTGKKSTKIV